MMNQEIKTHLTKQDKAKLYAVRGLIHQQPGRRITINGLVKMTGMYRSKLTAAFKQVYGKSIYHYLLDVRMKHAKKLLLANDLPAKFIARLCGYHTAPSFSRVFKKYYGLPPTQFQRKQPNMAPPQPLPTRPPSAKGEGKRK